VRPIGSKAGYGIERIKVLLVDDHAMVREGLKSILMGYPDLEVVGEAGDGEEAVTLAGEVAPHVIVMDVNMPKMDGIEATRRITCAYPDIVVIGLSVNATAHVAEGMKVAGALTLLTKESAAESLYYTIKRAAARPDRLPRIQQESLPFN
jgi:DNA-binding NarL/FixJ family response regulator